MRWADHKRITKDVSLVCGLPQLLAKQIAEASILPDKNPDYEIEAYVTGRRKKRIRTRKVRVKHHSQKAKEKAWNYLYQSRRALIKEDKNWIRYLGRALHYLQDYTVSKESEVFGIFPVNDWKKHDRLEASLSKVRFPLEPIKSLLKENIHANTLKNEVYMVKPSDNPADVFGLAVHLTALAIIGVVIPKEPENLDEEYRMARNRHLKFIGVPLIFAILFYILGHYGWMIGMILLTILIHYADSKFHYWGLEKNWFRP